MQRKFFLLFILVLDIYTHNIFSQEIKINSIKEAENDIAAREYELLDANGDASAIIKVRIGLKDIDFSADLGINRIAEKEGEFWLWVPPGTSSLQIITFENDAIEVSFPRYIEEYSVWIVIFTMVLSPENEYLDLPVLKVESTPQDADVFINNIYHGKTPISLSLFPDSFSYRIEKRSYHTFSGQTIMPENDFELSIPLSKSDTTNRYFILLETDMMVRDNRNGGFTFGTIGKTGWYVSVLFPLKKYYSGLKIESTSQNLNFTDYYLTPVEPVSLRLTYTNLSAGLTQYITRYLFANAGFSVVRLRLYQSFEIIPYKKNEPKEIVSGLRTDKSIIAFGTDIGAKFRIKNHLIFSLNLTSYFKSVQQDDIEYDNDPYDTKKLSYLISDLKAGIGYNF